MSSGPRLECGGAFFWGQLLLHCRKRRSFNQRKKVLLQAHSIGFSLRQQPSFDFRFEFQHHCHAVIVILVRHTKNA